MKVFLLFSVRYNVVNYLLIPNKTIFGLILLMNKNFRFTIKSKKIAFGLSVFILENDTFFCRLQMEFILVKHGKTIVLLLKLVCKYLFVACLKDIVGRLEGFHDLP